jgi:hypothetical protein
MAIPGWELAGQIILRGEYYLVSCLSCTASAKTYQRWQRIV